MLSLLSDENLNGDIVRGLLLGQPNLDLLRVQDVGLREVDDPAILAWAASHGRILLTHDRATMPDFAYNRLIKEEPMAGIFVVNDRMHIRQCEGKVELRHSVHNNAHAHRLPKSYLLEVKGYLQRVMVNVRRATRSRSGELERTPKSFPCQCSGRCPPWNVRPVMGGQHQQTRLNVKAPSEPN
jgi:predicted nuclease of predicted toxin-antitoxin system